MRLREPLPVLFAIVTEKNVEPVFHKGNVIRMTADGVEIQTANLPHEQVPKKFSNIKISLLDRDGAEMATDWYAKVMGNVQACATPPASAIMAHNTSMPPEAARFLRNILDAHKSPESQQGHSDFIESFITRE